MSAAPLIQFPRAELRDLIKEITDTAVVWDSEPEPLLGQVNGRPGYWVQLGLLHTTTKGQDENKVIYDPINEINGVTQVSYRIYTVHFRVISYNMLIPAFDVMDQIRRGLRSLTTQTDFLELGLAFVDWGNTMDRIVPNDAMSTTESHLDVRIAWQVSANPGDQDGNWIETVTTITPGLS